MRNRRRVVVEDVMTHAIFLGQPAQDIVLRAGVQSVQSTPITSSSGELVGVISTHFRCPHRVPAYRLRLMDIISRQVADFLRKT
jgi:GAF domain-containing protein